MSQHATPAVKYDAELDVIHQIMSMMGDFADFTVVDTRPVWESTAALTDNPPDWLFDTCALPNVAPPFPEMLMFGRGVFAYTCLEYPEHPMVGSLRKQLSDPRYPLPAKRPGESAADWTWPNLPEATRWLYQIQYVTDVPGTGLVRPAFWLLPVDATGKSLGLSGTFFTAPDMSVPIGVHEDWHVTLSLIVRVSLFGLSLMHCKNINVVDAEEPVTRQVRRARQRRGQIPSVQYKVLKIRPNAKGGEGGETGLSPLHICRGHFKTYTEEAPLFGRITGTYWWSDQVRGSAKNGIVVKDYEVS